MPTSIDDSPSTIAWWILVTIANRSSAQPLDQVDLHSGRSPSSCRDMRRPTSSRSCSSAPGAGRPSAGRGSRARSRRRRPTREPRRTGTSRIFCRYRGTPAIRRRSARPSCPGRSRAWRRSHETADVIGRGRLLQVEERDVQGRQPVRHDDLPLRRFSVPIFPPTGYRGGRPVNQRRPRRALPGGFPEEHVGALAANVELRARGAGARRLRRAGARRVRRPALPVRDPRRRADVRRPARPATMTARLTLGYRDAVALTPSPAAPRGRPGDRARVPPLRRHPPRRRTRVGLARRRARGLRPRRRARLVPAHPPGGAAGGRRAARRGRRWLTGRPPRYRRREDRHGEDRRSGRSSWRTGCRPWTRRSSSWRSRPRRCTSAAS